MKRRCLPVVAVCLMASLLSNTGMSAAQLTTSSRIKAPARVMERGQNHARWESVVEVTDPFTNEVVQKTNSYVQLETGLNYVNEQGDWQESSEEIELVPGAALARKGPHRVQWAANINTYGAITLITPDGEQVRSHVLGLAYYDPASGDSVMIADIRDSIGGVSGNKVIYEDAFDGVKADLRYTYTKAGFVQDVIVREQLPDPVALGFDPRTVQLQVLTEFVELPESAKEEFAAPADSATLDPKLRSAMEEEESSTDRYRGDRKYHIGSMEMGHGRAFDVTVGAGGRSVGVTKRFEQFQGNRNILVETVEFDAIHLKTEQLPPASKPTASLNLQRVDRPDQECALRRSHRHAGWHRRASRTRMF